MNNGRIPNEKKVGALLLGHPAATADCKLQTAESLRQKCSADRDGARLEAMAEMTIANTNG